jgi:phosphoesterase RecJ-like protein
MEGIEEVRSILSNPKNILITSHRNPDGDAIGSSLAMYHWLRHMGHTVMVAFPSEHPTVYNWMPGIDKVKVYDIESEDIDAFLENIEVSVILDYNALTRIDKMGKALAKKEPYTLLIDHHLYPEPLGDFILSDTEASSTCELVYLFMNTYSKQNLISIDIAECLYTGIVTDTGSFQYGTSPKVFRIIAELMESGVDNHALNHLIFNQLHEKNLRLLGHCLYNRMEILEEFKTGIIFLNKHDFKVFDIQRGDTEGIVNFLLKLKKVNMAVLVMQQPTIVKLSFRSKGNFSVEDIAKNHFNGGGHLNAAGGYSKQGLAVTMDKLKSILPNFKDKLNKTIAI